MPELQLQHSQQQQLLELVQAISERRAPGGWSRRRKACANTFVRSLGWDAEGREQHFIETDVEGRREHYKGFKLASNDPQSDGSSPFGQMDMRRVLQIAYAERNWISHLATEDSVDIDDNSVESLTEDAMLDRLPTAVGTEQRQLICDAETLRLTQQQRNRLAPILWRYIVEHRDSNDQEELVTVGSAIRKYIAMLDASRIGELAALLETGHRAPLPLELELEVAKMIYRKFEANPPAQLNPQPELGTRLWEMAEAYLNPRVLLRDKHATVASLAVEALVAMRSEHAEKAYQAAVASPFAWFGEMVRDNLLRLRNRWTPRNPDAAGWCGQLMNRVFVP